MSNNSIDFSVPDKIELKDSKFYLKLITNPLFEEVRKNKKIKLIFKASHYNFLAEKFHSLCDGKPNLIVIAENDDNYTFGGYTPLAWDIQKEKIGDYSKDKMSFIFSVNKNVKFNNQNCQNTLICRKDLGPSFGNDLIISDLCNLNEKSCCNLGNDYKNDRINASKTILTQKANFKIKEYEVFQLY